MPRVWPANQCLGSDYCLGGGVGGDRASGVWRVASEKERVFFGGVPPRLRSGQAEQIQTREYTCQRPIYLRPRLLGLVLARVSMAGQRAKTEVVNPPRGVNSPRTRHHSGR